MDADRSGTSEVSSGEPESVHADRVGQARTPAGTVTTYKAGLNSRNTKEAKNVAAFGEDSECWAGGREKGKFFYFISILLWFACVMYMGLNYFIKTKKISTTFFTMCNNFILINIIIKWET